MIVGNILKPNILLPIVRICCARETSEGWALRRWVVEISYALIGTFLNSLLGTFTGQALALGASRHD